MKKNFIALAEILKVFDLAKKQFHKQGLHQKSQQDWLELTKEFSDSPWIQSSQEKVTQYLAIEGQKVPVNQTFLATSDIIESIFGKYKIFSDSSTYSEINEMILTLLLCTTEFTPDLVLQAMESIQIANVTALVKRSFWSIYAL